MKLCSKLTIKIRLLSWYFFPKPGDDRLIGANDPATWNSELLKAKVSLTKLSRPVPETVLDVNKKEQSTRNTPTRLRRNDGNTITRILLVQWTGWHLPNASSRLLRGDGGGAGAGVQRGRGDRRLLRGVAAGPQRPRNDRPQSVAFPRRLLGRRHAHAHFGNSSLSLSLEN